MVNPLDQLKPKTKTKNQNIFFGVNEKSTTFLYTLSSGTRKNFFRMGKTVFCPLYLMCIKKSKCQQQKF